MMTQSKGIYLLPNILTTAGLLAGFFSIITATRAVYQG
ncbi:MAG TPA: CDP-diacylglycerol--serine O-phosphatidyltransferase, partial [Gammaproteobacteria bacterium]|nr:CDP-diacylglycerol--serine O-phosphatidyltransferase [Gammaproteobacteria bacterium]